MDRLIEGFRRFRENHWREHRDLFAALAQGQSPRAIVIACVDSRVDPQLIFSTAPGDIFVARNVANLVPPYQPTTELHGTSAAIEFAVRTMRVEHVIILGHSQCGGIGALLRDPEEHDDDFVAPWMEIAAPARARALAAAEGNAETAQHLCEREAIKVSLDNLMTFPWLRERVERRELALHGWHFEIATGDLQRLDKAGEFRRVEGT